jgi:hypothetical protein
MSTLPEHIEAELNRLIDEGMPASKIAFMMQLSRDRVDFAIRERSLNTTKKTAAVKAAE